MRTGMIRIGIVGAGANTRAKHIPNLQELDGVGVVSVCNRSLESTSKVAREFGIPTLYEHWQELVAAPDTDAILVGTWPHLHCPITLAALAANKHVLCEARMAMNAAQAHRMLDAAHQHPARVAMLVPAPHTLRVDKTIRRLLAEGYLGSLLAVEVRAGGSFLDPDAPLHWRQDFALSGFNTMTLGIWYESLLRWAGEAVQVTARGKTFATMRKDAQGNLSAVRVPEHVDVTADMACGAQAHLQISNVTGLAGPPEVWLFGSEGTLRFSEDKLYGGRKGDQSLQEIEIPPEEAGGWRVEEEFINAIRREEPVTCTTFAQGVQYMEFTEACARSLLENRPVALPLTLGDMVPADGH
ncbi:MAG: Gfo/Idh/MocA family protein [Armatimonadota bacterium]